MVVCYGLTETLNQDIVRLILFFASTLNNVYWQMSRVQASRGKTGWTPRMTTTLATFLIGDEESVVMKGLAAWSSN